MEHLGEEKIKKITPFCWVTYLKKEDLFTFTFIFTFTDFKVQEYIMTLLNQT